MADERIPYEDQYFNHIICCGAMHCVVDLATLFAEVNRMIKKGGRFAFTIAPQETKIWSY